MCCRISDPCHHPTSPASHRGRFLRVNVPEWDEIRSHPLHSTFEGRSCRVRLGISSFVSVGNKADVSTNDLLHYWEEGPATDVILLYAESFGNPRRFARIARRVSHRKPIVAVKAGRTQSGRRAAGSHTAALAASDVAVEALFRQTGVIRVETLDEMLGPATRPRLRDRGCEDTNESCRLTFNEALDPLFMR
jgi:hypothetical protein